MALVAGALLTLAAILYLARGALFPFIISIVLAELLYPVVAFVEKRLPSHDRWPGLTRISSILVIYLAFGLVMAGIAYLTIPPLFHEAQELVQALPSLYERARETAESWSRDVTDRIPAELRAQAEDAVAAGGDVLANAGGGILQRTVSGVSNAETLIIGLAIVPFFLFYILKDNEQVVGGIYPMMSPHGRMRTRHVFQLVNRVIGSYVRAQLLSATIVGGLVFVSKRASLHWADHPRHQVRRDPWPGRRIVRPDSHHWTGARRCTWPVSCAGKLPGPHRRGRPRLRDRPAH